MDPKATETPNPVAEDDEVEEKSSKEIYVDYRSAYVKFGVPHPQLLCVPDTLSWVDPPHLTYKLKLPSQLYSPGKTNKTVPLSNAQLECIMFACQAHESFLPGVPRVRQGFFIGDGTGVGKGREIAGIIYENWCCGRKKAVWISASNDLATSCRQELEVLNDKIPFLELNQTGNEKIKFPEGVIFLAYSSLITARYYEKLKSLLGPTNFNGVIAFDECHYAKSFAVKKKSDNEQMSKELNTGLLRNETSQTKQKKVDIEHGGSKTGSVVVDLQGKFPNARIIYSSATAASEIHHMLYMCRLGIWGEGTCFADQNEFCTSMEKRGNTALELLCVQLKMKGVFLARQISLKEVKFYTKEVKESFEFEEIYKRCSQIWILLLEYIKNNTDSKNLTTRLRDFWGSAQMFFCSLNVSSKVTRAVKLHSDFQEDYSMIFGLQKTGDSQYKVFLQNVKDKKKAEFQPYSYLEYSLRAAFASAGISLEYNNYYDAANSKDKQNNPKQDSAPVTKRPRNQIFQSWPHNCIGYFSERDVREVSWSYNNDDFSKHTLKKLFHQLRPLLPINPLDDLIDRLGGHKNVAELTSRNSAHCRIPRTKCWESKPRTTRVSLDEERKMFMDGKKEVVIISDVTSVGFSLHAHRDAKNTKKRCHVTLEYAWSPESVLQQLGRSHRSHQLQAPIYVFIKSPVVAEARFSEIVAKRLKQLGAICQAESNINPLQASGATGKIFSASGDKVIKSFLGDLKETCTETKREKMFNMLDSVGLYGSKAKLDAKRFLNRLLVLPIEYQKRILSEVDANLVAVLKVDQDVLMEFPPPGIKMGIRFRGSKTFKINNVDLTLYKFQANRTCDWDAMLKLSNGRANFFKRLDDNLDSVCCAVKISERNKDWDGLYNVIYPCNINFTVRNKRSMASCKWRPIDQGEAQKLWETEYEAYKQLGCQHAVKKKKCYKINCDFQWGIRNIDVVTGGIHTVWGTFETLFNDKIRLARVIENSKKYIGVYIEDTKKIKFRKFLTDKCNDKVASDSE